MAPVRCSYRDCLNTSMHHSLFRFPTKDEHRLRIWLKNAGNAALHSLINENLRNRFLCEAHFDAIYIYSETERKMLHKYALPRPYVKKSDAAELRHSPELNVKIPTKVYRKISNDDVKKSPIHSVLYNFDFPSLPTSEQVERLKNAIAVSNKIIKGKNIQLTKLKNKVQNKNLVDLDKFPFKSHASKVITKMQLKKQTRKWTQDENNFCVSLYRRSPGLYMFLHKTGIILASRSTVQRWQKQVYARYMK